MKIELKESTENIDWKAVAAIFSRVGWGDRLPEEIAQAFMRSSYVRFAFCEDELVGVGRTLDDERYYALIVDLAIVPEFQGNGIGSRILAELKDELSDYLFVTLTAAVGKEDFYRKQGWSHQKSAFMAPRSEKQKRDHAFED
jgi:aralkylamine N-acetyltransferase